MLVKVDNIEKKFSSSVILNNINLTINKGEIIGLIGENGSGKTTLIKLLSNILMPSQGKITQSSDTVISPLFDDGGLYADLTAYENLKIKALRLNIPENEIKNVMKLLNITDYGRKRIKQFSLGMKRRTAIAKCLLGKPNLVLLDEPINGLDPQGIKEIRNIIENIHDSNTSILISSHILDELSKVATRFVFLKKGNIIEDIQKEELQKKLAAKLIIRSKSTQKVREIIATQFNDDYIYIDSKDDIIRFQIINNQNPALIHSLCKENILIEEIYIKQLSLEEYYLNLAEEGNYELL